MKILSVLCLLMFAATAIAAADLETVVAPPAEPVKAGQASVFTAYVHNTGEKTVFITFPERLTCRIEAGGRIWSVDAQALSPGGEQPATVPKNGFARKRYGFIVSPNIQGVVRMTVDAFAAAPVMFAVSPADTLEAAANRAGKTDAVHAPVTMESLFALYQPYVFNMAAYEPMYFLVGADPEESKFQISFKYRFFNDDNPMAVEYPWVKGFHLGYTQTSFWDLASDSAPFEDTSYKPELFYLSSNIAKRPSWIKGLFFQTGVQHESNGRGGEFSRSTNILYVKPMAIFYSDESRWGLQVAPKIWAYVNNDEDTNPDIENYRGFFDLELKLGKARGPVMGSNFRWAEHGASVQVDFTYPLNHYFLRNLDMYFQVQYVNALAEDLIDYRQRREALRMGFAIVR